MTKHASNQPGPHSARTRSVVPGSRGWTALPLFGIRQAGFPFSWLGELAAPPAAAAALTLLEGCSLVERALKRIRWTLREVDRSPGEDDAKMQLPPIRLLLERGQRVDPAALSSLTSAALRESFAEACAAWSAAIDVAETASADFISNYKDVLQGTSRAVADRFQANQMKNVLLISNHHSYRVFEDFLNRPLRLGKEGLLDRRDRAKIDTLVMYLQRICAKNDTTSHFGPFTLGYVDAAISTISWNGVGPQQAKAFYSHWAAEEIAAVISHTYPNAPWLRPRRRPGAFLDGTCLQLLESEFEPPFIGDAHRAVSLLPPEDIDSRDADILVLCTGQHTLHQIYQSWRTDRQEDWDKFLDRVRHLKAVGALSVELEVPVGIPHPIAQLLDDLPATYELSGWRHELETATQSLAEFPAADLRRRQQLFIALEEQFVRLTGHQSARNLGKTYADRSLLSEECHRVLPDLRIGGSLPRAIEDDLAPVYDLFLLGPRRRLRAEQKLLAEWWTGRYGSRRSVSPAIFLEDFLTDADRLEPSYEAIDQDIDALNGLVRAELIPDLRLLDPVVEIDRQRLIALLNQYAVSVPAVCNADLMIMAHSVEDLHREEFQLVVGECHALRELLSHGPMGSFIQAFDPGFSAQVAASYTSLLAPDEIVVDVIRSHTDKTQTQIALPGYDLEIQGRSPKARDHVLALHDLEVVSAVSGLRLYAPRLRRFVRLMGGTFQLKRNPFNVFGWPRYYEGPPVKTTELLHVPRLVLGRVVLQREHWRVPAGEFSQPIIYGHARFDDVDGGEFLRAKRVQCCFGLPRHVFVKLPGEDKPVYVDFDAPLLTRQLSRLTRRAHGMIEVTEMLPGPDDLWFSGSDGPVTCEVRLSLFSQANGPRADDVPAP